MKLNNLESQNKVPKMPVLSVKEYKTEATFALSMDRYCYDNPNEKSFNDFQNN